MLVGHAADDDDDDEDDDGDDDDHEADDDGDLLPLLKTVGSSWKVESPPTELRLPRCAWEHCHHTNGDNGGDGVRLRTFL